jgi:hypothetical protein
VPDALVQCSNLKRRHRLHANDIEPDVLPWLERNTRSSVAAHDGTTFQYIGINLTHPILRQRKVRQAIASPLTATASFATF